MKNTVQFILAVLIISGCRPSGVQVVSSPDKKLQISYMEYECFYPYPHVLEWINVFHFKSGSRWQKDSSQTLAFNYYCDDVALKNYYDELHREESCEWETGFKPIRIDQIELSDGTPIYLVYALTYADTAYHDYYYSYTSLCIIDGKIWKYPLFKEIMEQEEPKSDIVIINPSSIDLDFTTHPSYYEYGLDYKIIETWEDERIWYRQETHEIVFADDAFSYSFENDSLSIKSL